MNVQTVTIVTPDEVSDNEEILLAEKVRDFLVDNGYMAEHPTALIDLEICRNLRKNYPQEFIADDAEAVQMVEAFGVKYTGHGYFML